MRPHFTPEKLLKIMTEFCSKDETRPQLQGIFYDPSHDRGNCVATNGYRMAVVGNRLGENPDSFGLFDEKLKGLIINPKTMLTIYRDYPKWQDVFPIKKQDLPWERLEIEAGRAKSWVEQNDFFIETAISGPRFVPRPSNPEEGQPEWIYGGEVIGPLFRLFGGKTVLHCIHGESFPALIVKTQQIQMLFVLKRNNLWTEGE